MKTKLLKKIRKRFSIIHAPNGLYRHGDVYDYNLFILVDNNESSLFDTNLVGFAQLGNNKLTKFVDDIFNNKKDCIDFLKNEIVHILKKEGHMSKKDKQRNNNTKLIF